MRFKGLLVICLLSWLTIFKYITFIPAIDMETHEVTGFEFKIKFWVGRGK